MKVFATLATVLGASTATPLFQNQLQGSNDMRLNQHSMHSVMKPSMGMSMEMSQHDNSDRRMDMNHEMSNMRDMYRDNQDMDSNKMDHHIMGQEMSSNMRDMHRQNQASLVKGFSAPNQYFVKDDLGNYVYSYNDQQSEKSEEGNAQSIKGQYAYLMSNGVERRVEYIADNDGFHIIKDNADPARIKRSAEPDLIQNRMGSDRPTGPSHLRDSSSLMNDARDMYRMSNMMGQDMPSNMYGREQQRDSNRIDHRFQVKPQRDNVDQRMDMIYRQFQDESDHQFPLGSRQAPIGPALAEKNERLAAQVNTKVGEVSTALDNILDYVGRHPESRKFYSNMIDQDYMRRNMMGQDTMGRNIYNIMSNRGMTSDVSNLMGQQMNSQMMGRNMLGQRYMTPNMMYSDMMGQDRMDMINSRGMTYDSLVNNGLMGQRMMQKMEIERVPETYYTSTRFF